MKKHNKTINNPFLILTIISAVFLIYIMIALIIYKEQIFVEREILSFPEIIIGIGFVLILLFNIKSILWLVKKFRNFDKVTFSKKKTLALGGLCLLLMLGEKTMIDEIGREYLLGWETLGEWIILYVFLAIQLFYNFTILKILRK